MRYLLAALAIAGATALAATPASARGYHRHHLTHKYAHYLSGRHFRHDHARRHWRLAHRGDRPGCFYVAALMGGPCGCWAAAMLLHVEAHVWHGINLWLANDWTKFPHVAPEQATAVVWPGRHVAPIVPGTYRNGTVVVRDSWATHRVRTAGLVLVDPLRAFAPRSPRRVIAWPSSVPL